MKSVVNESDDLEPGKGYWVLFRDFTYQSCLNLDGLSMDADFLKLLCELDCAVVVSKLEPKLEEVITFIMTLKSNEEFILSEGLYFLVELTLEKDSILNTDGDVQIYVKKLELEENARLMGAPSTNPDEAKPNDLVILAQRWERAYYDSED